MMMRRLDTQACKVAGISAGAEVGEIVWIPKVSLGADILVFIAETTQEMNQ